MSTTNQGGNCRILVIDDNRAIHEDFRKILVDGTRANEALDRMSAALFDQPANEQRGLEFKIESAYQGEEALRLVRQSLQAGQPYAMAFMDVRMPPGWDGVETTLRLWEADPDIQVVICTAYSDYSWDELIQKLGNSDRFVVLKKPFDSVEVLQLTHALTEKWRLLQLSRCRMQDLEEMVDERTRELKSVNEALGQSEKRFRDLFENSPDAVFVEDLAGNVLDVNPAACRLHGLKREQLVGKNVLELIPAGEREEARRDFQKMVSGKTRRVEGFSLAADGRATPVELKASRIEYCGKPALLLHVRDITERKLAQERERTRSQILESLGTGEPLDSILERIARFIETEDPSALCSILLLDEKGKHLLHSAAPSLPDFYNQAVHGLAIGEGMGSCGTAAYTGKRVIVEDVLAHPYWSAYHDLTQRAGVRACWSQPFFSSTGQMLGTFAIYHREPRAPTAADIERIESAASFARLAVERKRAEANLARLSQQNELILNSAGEGILGLDMEGNHTFVNPAAAKMLGYEVGELVGRQSHSIWHHKKPDGSPYSMDECPIYAAFKDGVVRHASDEVFWRKDGTSFHVAFVSTPIREHGKLIGAVVAFKDVTERRHLEEQLRQSQKMEAIGHLAGGVAHDFNNILTAITGYCEMTLRHMDAQQPLRRNIEEISKAAARAAGLTRQLLAFSRKQALEPRVLDLNTLLADLETMLRRVIGENITLKTSPSRGLAAVKADPGQIEQVILNLVVNARDAMPQGGLLTIETANVELDDTYARQHVGVSAGSHVMLAISDTGIGMTPEVKARLFEPFFTTKPQGKGTGLGLATSFGIVKQSDGHINVYSEPGKGTTFRIYLPSVAEKANVQPQRKLDTVIPRGHETVLLVEDEPALRELGSVVLQELGYTVLVAANGNEALAITEKRNGDGVDLVLTDVVMPEMGGAELAERIHASHPETKVLYASGYTADAIVHHGVLEPGVALLHKPYTTMELACKVRSVLDCPQSDIACGTRGAGHDDGRRG